MDEPSLVPPKRGRGRPRKSATLTEQTSQSDPPLSGLLDISGSAPAPVEQVTKKRGRPRKCDASLQTVDETVAIATQNQTASSFEALKGKEIVINDELQPSENPTGRSKRSGKRMTSYAEQSNNESEEESSSQNTASKRQKVDKSQESPTDVTPTSSSQSVVLSSIPSARTSKKPKAKGVKIWTEYTSDPSAVYIEPLETARGDLVFNTNGDGTPTYGGATNEEDSKIRWWFSVRFNPYNNKLITDPPKLTLKKWRAMLAFRQLDISGTLKEMQDRLKVWLENEDAKAKKALEEPDHGMVVSLERIPKNDSQIQWTRRNAVERERLWSILPIEKQFHKNILRFLEETVLRRSSVKDVFVFKTCPNLSDQDWIDICDRLEDSRIGLIFTSPPQSPKDAPVDNRYQRGDIHGTSWVFEPEFADENLKYLGGTWAGTGFEKGMIVGSTRALVKEKVEEICEQVKANILGRYIENARKEKRNSQLASSKTQEENATAIKQNHEWTKEEIEQAQVEWDHTESKKMPLNLFHYTYRLGKLFKLPELPPAPSIMTIMTRAGRMHRGHDRFIENYDGYDIYDDQCGGW